MFAVVVREVVPDGRVGRIQFARDLVFGLHLFDEANVFLRITMDVLQCVDLLRRGILHEVDRTSRTFPQPLQNIIVKEFLGHEPVVPPVCLLFPRARQVDRERGQFRQRADNGIV